MPGWELRDRVARRVRGLVTALAILITWWSARTSDYLTRMCAWTRELRGRRTWRLPLTWCTSRQNMRRGSWSLLLRWFRRRRPNVGKSGWRGIGRQSMLFQTIRHKKWRWLACSGQRWVIPLSCPIGFPSGRLSWKDPRGTGGRSDVSVSALGCSLSRFCRWFGPFFVLRRFCTLSFVRSCAWCRIADTSTFLCPLHFLGLPSFRRK